MKAIKIVAEPTEICRGFRDEDWKLLRKGLIGHDGVPTYSSEWSYAVDVFERRIRERFILCIESLDNSGSPSVGQMVPGFAIMALCCLLIETLQSFRKGSQQVPAIEGPCLYPAGKCIYPRPSTNELFKDFLRLPAFRGAFDKNKIVQSFTSGIRNGILHESQTRNWIIRKNEPEGQILMAHNKKGYILNRTKFYKALKSEFEAYLQQLRNPVNLDLRRHFVDKMDNIVLNCG